MSNLKKAFLILSVVVLSLTLFVVPSFALQEPLLDKKQIQFYDYIQSTWNCSFRSTASGNSTVITTDSGSLGGVKIFTINTKDVGFISGESYKIFFPFYNTSSYDIAVEILCLDGNQELTDSSQFDNAPVIHNQTFSANTNGNINCLLSIPSDFVSGRIFILFSSNTPNSFSFQLGVCTLEYVNKVDTGDWVAPDETFDDIELGDMESNFEQYQSDAINSVRVGFNRLSNPVHGVLLVFGSIWDILEDNFPELTYIIIFSLVGGIFVLLINKVTF